MRNLRWIAPTLVLCVAAVLRFWALARPDVLVFDELYYVRDAISQLAHGFPTVWPDDNPGMSGARATAFTDEPSNAVHPPLGKWIIGLGILLFGPDDGWGWRSAVAVAGVATVGVTMRLAWRISHSLAVACAAGLLLALDGVHVVLSRVALLDGPLTLAIAIGALLLWRDQEAVGARFERCRSDPGATVLPMLWRRPWLLAAGAAFGAAAAIKWSGLYPLAFFLLFVTVRDLLARLRLARLTHAGLEPVGLTHAGLEPGRARPPRRPRGRAWLAALGQAVVAGAIALPAAFLVYLSSWAGWILNPGGWGRDPGVPWPAALLEYHRQMWEWHSTLSAPHPYSSPPLTWPLALKPTGMYETRWSDGCRWDECVSGITPLPNALVTWGGVAALVWLVVLIVRAARRSRPGGSPAPILLAGSFVVTAYLSGWLPWVLTLSRSAVFQFYAVVLTPFSAIALALVLGVLAGIPAQTEAATGMRLDPSPEALRGRRIAVTLFLVATAALAILFFPVWSAMPVADWFWQLHIWLPWWA